MYTIVRNGAIIAVINADDMRLDMTNPNESVVVFIKGDNVCSLEEDNHHHPYLDWEPREKRRQRREKQFGRNEHGRRIVVQPDKPPQHDKPVTPKDKNNKVTEEKKDNTKQHKQK